MRRSHFALCASAFCGLLVLTAGEVHAKKRKAVLQLLPVACTAKVCSVQGRLVRSSRWLRKKKKPSRFRLFMRAVRRLTRGGVGLTTVNVRFCGQMKSVVTDKQGYFQARFWRPKWPRAVGVMTRGKPSSRVVSRPSTQPTSKKVVGRVVHRKWPEVRIKSARTSTLFSSGLATYTAALDPKLSTHVNGAPARGIVVVPTKQSGVSVISDVDDTLIHTHVTSKRKLLKTFLFRSYAQIKVVPDSLAFVQALLQGRQGRGGGTMHYVTGSPMRIFDRVYKLFQLRRFPVGSLHMKRLSGAKAHGLSRQVAYKLSHILPLFKRYPKRRFVLIGDSGEKDPLVYKKVRAMFPKRVLGIYIHHVSKDSPKADRFRGVVLFRKYRDAIRDARRRGLIR